MRRVRPVACDTAGRSRPQANWRGDHRSLIRGVDSLRELVEVDREPRGVARSFRQLKPQDVGLRVVFPRSTTDTAFIQPAAHGTL
jgi:hypothetical protein